MRLLRRPPLALLVFYIGQKLITSVFVECEKQFSQARIFCSLLLCFKAVSQEGFKQCCYRGGVRYSLCFETMSESCSCHNRFKLEFSHLLYVKQNEHLGEL